MVPFFIAEKKNQIDEHLRHSDEVYLMFSVVQKYTEKDIGSGNIWLWILQLTSDNKKIKVFWSLMKTQSIPPYSQSDMSLLNLLKLSWFLFLTMSKQ